MNILHTNKITLLGVFASALLVTASAVYIYSPVNGSHADSSAGTDVNLSISSAIALRTDTDELDLNASVGSFVHGTVNADVITNSQYGYTLTLEDTDNNSSMTSTTVSDVVTSDFAGAKTSATMGDNTWGYSLNQTDYYYIPVNGNPAAIKRTSTVMSGDYDRTAVEFGVKTGMLLTAGTYADSVLFTAYVNGADGDPVEANAPVISNPGYVSPCKTAPYVSNGVLTDPRDGKTYTVKALKDGKCWMTQNLALIDAELTSANSNLPEGETFTVPASSTDNFSPSNHNAAYLQSEAGYGALYSFYTATAGWGTTSVTSGNSPKDICPKGWRMPTGGGNGEYMALMTDYYPGTHYADQTPFANELGYILSGSIDYSTLSAQGERGFYWTSTAYSANNANFFYISKSNINPNNDFAKYYGYAVRCVAK